MHSHTRSEQCRSSSSTCAGRWPREWNTWCHRHLCTETWQQEIACKVMKCVLQNYHRVATFWSATLLSDLCFNVAWSIPKKHTWSPICLLSQQTVFLGVYRLSKLICMVARPAYMQYLGSCPCTQWSHSLLVQDHYVTQILDLVCQKQSVVFPPQIIMRLIR